MPCELSDAVEPAPSVRPSWVKAPDLAARARALALRFETAYGRPPVGVWAAPGRANLMGEYIDYSGGMCLPFAHQYATLTAAAPRTDGTLHARSLQDGDASVADRQPRAVAVADVAPGTVHGWFGYAAGVAWGMNRVARGASEHEAVPELALAPHIGADLLVDSTVPIGAGLSSSAALECSVGLALYSLSTGDDAPEDRVRRGLARACMDAENYIVGADTGGLDQTASLRSHAGQILALDCRDFSAVRLSADPAHAGLAWLGIDTRAPHRLADGQYSSRRAQCERAADILGVARLRDALPEHPTADDVAAVLERFDRLVAARGAGAASSNGAATRLGPMPEVTGVRLRLRHSMTEMVRSETIARALHEPEPDWAHVGRLLTEGHASMRDDCQVTVPELDVAVEASCSAGALGAKVVGGGFGGSVLALVPADAVASVAAAVDLAFGAHGFRAPLFLPLSPSEAGRRVW